MLVLLTQTILMRVEDQEEAGEIAAGMTQAMEDSMLEGWRDRGITPEEGRKYAHVLGTLVQVIPEDVAT